jgi:hypothetical protein
MQNLRAGMKTKMPGLGNLILINKRAVVTFTHKYDSCPVSSTVKPNRTLMGFAKMNVYGRMEVGHGMYGKGDNRIAVMKGSNGVECGRKGKRNNHRPNKIKW